MPYVPSIISTPQKIFLVLLVVTGSYLPVPAQQNRELTIAKTAFRLNGEPFPYTGISFFNAIYNPAFNKNQVDRKKWLQQFQRYGINVLRVWGQWDNKCGFVDASPTNTLYYPDGRLRHEHVNTLKAISKDAADLKMVIELALFARESWGNQIRLAPAAADKAVAALTKELLPFRNITFQIWNEHDDRVLDHYRTIKAQDPKRLVTNSPGYAGVLGDSKENATLDYLTPHTSRHGKSPHWEIAPQEIAYLLARYQKPVVDDEPARNGTSNFGGPQGVTYPQDHILQIQQVWQLGGYITYHHDMFQKGYGDPSVPPNGIPDPAFNPYHRAVLEFIALQKRYHPE
jgi:hypothetical protein